MDIFGRTANRVKGGVMDEFDCPVTNRRLWSNLACFHERSLDRLGTVLYPAEKSAIVSGYHQDHG